MSPDDDGRRPAFLALFEERKGKRSWPHVAVKAGVSESSLPQWMANRYKAPLVEMVRVARELGISPEELFSVVLSDEAPSNPVTFEDLLARVERLEATLGSPAMGALLADRVRAGAAIGARRVREADSAPGG